MKRHLCMAAAVAAMFALCAPADAAFEPAGNTVVDSFEQPWSGDYAPGWENIQYRWGQASQSVMMQQTAVAHSGTYGLQLSITAVGDPPSSTNWWGGIAQTAVPTSLLDKQYDPWVSVWFYDQGGLPSGYLAAVPETSIPDDWTDLQLGTRHSRPDNYWYGSAPANGGVGWLESSIARTQGWHEFKMTLASDGTLDYYIDGSNVGTSPRTDYDNLAEIYLGIWTPQDEQYPYSVYFDDVTIGSTALPEPASILVWGLLAASVASAGWRRRRQKRT